MAETREIVVPGELVGDTSQLRPGQNTYQEGSNIYALRLGVKTVRGDRVNVISLSGRYEPFRGDVVIGTIAEVGPSNWYINIGAANDVGMHVNDVPWRVEFGETSKYLAVGDTVLLKIVHVDEMKKAQVSMKDRQCRKLTGGLIFDVAPTKVPRIVGRNGSMIQLIKDATNVRMFVGQNGHVWLDGEPDDVQLALEALRKIEAEAHTMGLTDRMKAWLEERRPSANRVHRAPEPAEDAGAEGAPDDAAAAPTERPGRRERDERRASERPPRRDDRPPRDERPPRREAPPRDEPRRRFEDERPAPRRFDDERPMRRADDERPARRFDEARSGRSREGDAEPQFGGERPPRREAPLRDEPRRRFEDERPAPRRFDDERPMRRADDERPIRRMDDELRSRRSGEGEAEPQFGQGPRRRYDDERPPRRDERPARRMDDERPAPRRMSDDDRAPRRDERPAPRRFDDERRPAPRRFEEPEERPRRAPVESDRPPRAFPTRRDDDEDEGDDDDRPAPRREGSDREGGGERRRRRGGRGRGRGGSRGDRSD